MTPPSAPVLAPCQGCHTPHHWLIRGVLCLDCWDARTYPKDTDS